MISAARIAEVPYLVVNHKETLTPPMAPNATSMPTEPDIVISSSVYASYGAYVVLVLIFGLSQNLLTLYVFYSDRRLHSMHNYFIVGLSLADIGMCVFGNWMIIASSFSQHWVFGRIGCVFYGFATTWFGISQISILAAIAIDRYVIIVKPRGIVMTKQKAFILVICCFGHGFVWALLPAIGWNSYSLEGIGLRCAINWRSHVTSDITYSMAILICGWICPLSLILFSYRNIFITLQCKRTRIFGQSSLNGRTNRQRNDRKMAITVLCMICAFFISWTPYAIVTLCSAFGYFRKLPVVVTVLPALFAKSSIILNPIIYVARNTLFRRALFQRVPFLHNLHRTLSNSSKQTVMQTSEVSVNEIRDITHFQSSSEKVSVGTYL
ncbi:visual pigment-like receptor peropsin [Dreissena polymorpha]|nr:visual pigment-like receptor peropsin [Dreissena polymorpha]